jgi:thioredoxin reductase/NAD-dependent dihydropyrimidine dehydrogenase PreA subunit
MSDAALIAISGVVLTALAVVPVVLHLWRKERVTDEAEALALEYGLHEPATLHPMIDPDRCIGTGSCIDVCPEGKVIGLRHGQAIAVAPASCIGHGLCERSCPMEAIQLVFGTAKRGVDIPRIKGDFETNVSGLYIVGELGGMGLIRNAFNQGKQCVDGIAARRGSEDGDTLDLVIVGAGPAGLSASLHARHHGLRFVTIDREPDLGGTVRHYPRKKLVMTEPVKIPGIGRIGAREIRKEELIEVWNRVAEEAQLPLALGQLVESVTRVRGGFEVRAGTRTYGARRVVLAIGRRGVPRKLGVPGEELPNVQYALAEPESFSGDRVLVVGGGDSAVEAALALSEQPATSVRVSYRRDRFSRIKPGNRERIEAAMADSRLEVHWATSVDRVERGRVWLTGASDPFAVDTDQVFVFAGGELPTPFLKSCGVEIDTKFGAP